ncbi:Guanine nucleotide-binding protein alpha-2 subunit [Apophysomyces sp. BC1034]|nr:Guanine nucleotide-binding protein alpha-2 subunit [Apophysomyces sp. BC1015]KAG0183341.1 Guanine nucleotide-binding protein alpha-2 subunit [Apophysomyces sp. BC1021]KAG0194216.1 Guanine nucleotide-binding protein alpha-2 subunit [Apophysomyces sp. BC1034]
MGLCISLDERQSKQRSLKIDRQLEADFERHQKECKILLLGSGESGKSTIAKQMKIIHQDGYTTEELMTWRHTIFKNLVDSIQDLLNAARKLDIQLEPENEALVDQILEFQFRTDLPSDFISAVNLIWKDKAIPDCLEKGSSQCYIMDSAKYFLSDADRVGQPDYIPTVDDVLYARVKTTGISETRFALGQLNVHMFDMGGQRSERKKWIHCFEAVTSIIFCVALNEYDQVLLEESKQNRMVESLVLFESVINSRWFLRTSIVLFLNKVDLFREKIVRVPLQRYFPEYSGGPEAGHAIKYILWRFRQTNRLNLQIFPQVVFDVVRVTLLKNALKDCGIM